VIGASGANAPLSSVNLTTMDKNWSDIVTIKGVADANSQIKLYDGKTSLGTVTTAVDGTWSFKTSSAVSDTVHTYTAKQIDSTGQVVGTSGSAILGSTGSNTLKGTSGNDIFVGDGGADTFVFAAKRERRHQGFRCNRTVPRRDPVQQERFRQFRKRSRPCNAGRPRCCHFG